MINPNRVLINLHNNHYFKDSHNLERLNDIVALHTVLSLGLLMSYTSCSSTDALYILLLLFEKKLAKGYFLIYHSRNPDRVIQRREFMSGLPKIPFLYDDEGETIEINDAREVFYTFEFEYSKTLSIVFEVI